MTTAEASFEKRLRDCTYQADRNDIMRKLAASHDALLRRVEALEQRQTETIISPQELAAMHAMEQQMNAPADSDAGSCEPQFCGDAPSQPVCDAFAAPGKMVEPATASEDSYGDRELAARALMEALQTCAVDNAAIDRLAAVYAPRLAADRQRIAELERQFADKDRDLALQIANATLLARERDAARAELLFEHVLSHVDRVFQVCTENPHPILPDYAGIGRDKFAEVERLATDYVEAQAKLAALETASNTQANEWKERALLAESAKDQIEACFEEQALKAAEWQERAMRAEEECTRLREYESLANGPLWQLIGLPVRFQKALMDVKEFASAHHETQGTNEWLHALRVDIPHMIDSALDAAGKEGI